MLTKEVFTAEEIALLSQTPGYDQLTDAVMARLFDELTSACLRCDWTALERILAGLLNTNVQPSQLVGLANTDLAAFVSHIHLQTPSRELSFSIRMATLLVAWWADALKIALLLINEVESDSMHASCVTQRLIAARARAI